MKTKKLDKENLLAILDSLKNRIASGEIVPGECQLNVSDPTNVMLGGLRYGECPSKFIFTLEYDARK